MITAYVKLGMAALLPVALALVFYSLEKYSNFGKWGYWRKQLVIGLAFGVLAIVGTEWGIPLNGVQINCRDAAPLTAGFIFGGPAGIIAGIVGGIERWLSVYWGIGSFTRVACSVSTCLAGFYAAFLRRFLFEGKKPTWFLGLIFSCIMEGFHILLVFVTNINDATTAINIVKTCIVPMVIANGLSVMFSLIVIYIVSRDYTVKWKKLSREEKPIFITVQKWLLIVVVVLSGVSIGFIYMSQTNMAKETAKTLLINTVNETASDVEDICDYQMKNIAHLIAKDIAAGDDDLVDLAQWYGLTDVSIINSEGIVVDSNNQSNINYNMADGEQSSEFLCLLDGETTEYVQAFGPISQNRTIYRKYAAVVLEGGGFVQISYDSANLKAKIIDELDLVVKNKSVGTYGGVVIADKFGELASASKKFEEYADRYQGGLMDLDDYNVDGQVRVENFNGEQYFTCGLTKESFIIIAVYAYDDAYESRDISMCEVGFLLLIMFTVLYILLYLLIKYLVVNRIVDMASSLSRITSGNLEEVVEVRTTKEFASLSDDINSTVTTLKELIAEAAARIDAELEFAREIQSSSLPSTFPAFPNRNDFDIYACMDTAKEVGGDFYDFYMTSDKTLNFLIADVSGKGIPAAMFMMKSKSVLKSFTQQGKVVNDVFVNANNVLSDDNDAGMFVTAWQGCIDLENGAIQYADAGHNPPVIKHKDGSAEYLVTRPNLVLGGMSGLKYKLNETKLEHGDIIYLYTDGITEATSAENELYGEERLLNVIKAYDNTDDADLKKLCEDIRADIDAFVKDAPQFDDMTMLALKYI